VSRGRLRCLLARQAALFPSPDLPGAGTHVEWPSIDEHVGVWTLLGVPEDDVLEAAGFTMEHRAARA
jgi:hypothetical protein